MLRKNIRARKSYTSGDYCFAIDGHRYFQDAKIKNRAELVQIWKNDPDFRQRVVEYAIGRGKQFEISVQLFVEKNIRSRGFLFYELEKIQGGE